MTYKQILLELCDNLERGLAMGSSIPSKVKLVSTARDGNYGMPEIYIGTGMPKRLSQPAWFGEIYIDGCCVARDIYYYQPSESPNTAEEIVMKRLLNEMFCYGLMSAKRIIDKQETRL